MCWFIEFSGLEQCATCSLLILLVLLCLLVPYHELLSPLVQSSLLLPRVIKINQESTSTDTPCQPTPSIIAAAVVKSILHISRPP